MTISNKYQTLKLGLRYVYHSLLLLIVEYSADAPLPDAKYRDGMNTQNHTLGELE
jgi:hypothetical protein